MNIRGPIRGIDKPLKIALAVGAIVFGLLGLMNRTYAYDQQISSTLWAEGYSVPSRDGSDIRRRRIIENLRLSTWNLLPGSDHPYYRGPHLSFELELKLDTDFAITADESRPSREHSYVPGLTPVALDVMVAQLDARGLWDGVLDIRLGRQIRFDTLGLTAFDGIATHLRLPIGLGFDTYFGYEVRGGYPLGFDALELDGTDSGGRHDMAADRYPDRTDPEARLALGLELSYRPRYWLDAGLSFRTIGLSQPLADERVGARVRVGTTPVWFDARAVWHTLTEGFSEIDSEFAVEPHDQLTFSLSYQYYRPVFEGDSIFNVFDFTPENDLGGRIEVDWTKSFATALWGFTRLAEDTAGLDGNSDSTWLLGAGGGLGANYYHIHRTLSLRLSYLQEWGDQRFGAEIGGNHGFLRSDRLWLGVRLSFWHIEDQFSDGLSGNLGGYVLSARFQLAQGAVIIGEFEHYIGDDGDQRFYGTALLNLDLWR